MKLVVQSGAAANQSFPLTRNRLVIGRAPGNDIYIGGDELISRRHAELRRQGQGWVVTDLGSRNGTRVNDVRISGSQMLQTGDSLRVGHTTLVLDDSAPLAVPEPRSERVRSGGPMMAEVPATPKDSGTALILEIIPGLLGFPGFGWIYAGNLARGLVTLIGYWLLVGLEILLGGLFSAVTLGLGTCIVLPLVLIINGGFIGLSAHQLNRHVQRLNQETMVGAHGW